MKLALSAALLTQLFSGVSGEGSSYTYFEDGGLGPSNWANLEIEDNECGGTQGKSGFGQSPVTVDEATVSGCDTNMKSYNFMGGDCAWTDLSFTISNGGKQDSTTRMISKILTCRHKVQRFLHFLNFSNPFQESKLNH